VFLPKMALIGTPLTSTGLMNIHIYYASVLAVGIPNNVNTAGHWLSTYHFWKMRWSLLRFSAVVLTLGEV